MTTNLLHKDEKIQAVLDFAETLSYTDKIVFSDEGNLASAADIDERQQENSTKPFGLWYSYGKAWIELLSDSDWGKKRIANISHIYKIETAESVLCIDNFLEFLKFEKRYANRSRRLIRWPALAERHDGIQIRFQKTKADCEHDDFSPWYEHWDVSCGCIWHKTGLHSVQLLRRWQPCWLEALPHV